jgi:hypothetical protein
MFDRLFAVAIDKIFALESHTVLHRNAAAQRFHAFNIALGNGFRMIEEPVQAVERNIAVHLLKHVQHPADGFIIGGMQAERPAVFHQMAHHPLQLIFHPFRQIRTRLQEIFKIRRREDQHLPAPLAR